MTKKLWFSDIPKMEAADLFAQKIQQVLALCDKADRRWTDEDGVKMGPALISTKQVREILEKF